MPVGICAAFSEKRVAKQPQSPFPLHQRLALGLFCVIGVATLALGGLRLASAIGDPLRLRGGGTFKTAEQVERERAEQLKSMDTDRDGLSDHDELYVFRTSPFLEDSDSDGDTDGKEVENESDPNCPKTKNCRPVPVAPAGGGTAIGATGSTTAGGTVGAPPAPAGEEVILAAIMETFGDPSTMTPESIAEDIAKLSSDELRGFLVKLGVPATALEKTDDATLRQLLSEALAEMAKVSAATEKP